jgi:hypothetical protein
VLKATLIAVLLLSVADAVAFKGYYRHKTFETSARFITKVGSLDWAGFLT